MFDNQRAERFDERTKDTALQLLYVAKWEQPFRTTTAADQSEDATKATSVFQIILRLIGINIDSYLFSLGRAVITKMPKNNEIKKKNDPITEDFKY